LLANDLLAFQLEQDRHNFLQAADRLLLHGVNVDGPSVSYAGHTTSVISAPIGIDFDRIQTLTTEEAVAAERLRLTGLFELTDQVVGVGVDRLDYTKGIPERLAALDDLLEQRPDLVSRLTFVQVGVPSRSELRNYAAVENEVTDAVAALNRKYDAVRGNRPLIRYHRTPFTLTSLVALYQLAHFCVVSSLHDGMNLVAKEFIASRHDEDGVLVLSNLAGAAEELTEALLINPYDREGFAAALRTAVAMPADERHRRMRALRHTVAGRDIFLWASDILNGLDDLNGNRWVSAHEWRDIAV
jgi:trehalose 6-phosphate synthase